MKTSITILLLLPAAAWVCPAIAQQPAVKEKNDSLQTNTKTVEMRQVEVRGTSVKSLQQSARAVTVIDARKYYNRPAAAISLINQSPGVRVRQDGGLGSRADISINGIGGKQVKFFINGIPADLLGAGNRINIFPVNAIDRIEIYKGVLPVELSSDALGGAINIVTRQQLSNYTDATYSFGSFNTHKAALNIYSSLFNDHFIQASGFFNYSDNNYRITADVPDQWGNPVKQQVKRFHDRYRDRFAQLEIGVTKKKWADVFSINGSYYGMDKEVQNNVVMTEPYGAVTRDERTWNLGVRYSKLQLLPRLQVSAYANTGLIKEHFIDTSFNAFTWDGKVYERRNAYGEISSSRTNLLFTTRNILGQVNLDYTLDSLRRLSMAVSGSYFHRTGKDSIAEQYYGQNYYGHPVRMQKNTVALAYQQAFKKFTSVTAIKFYRYRANGFTIDNLVFNPAAQAKQQLGWSESLKWRAGRRYIVKLSYEYATRLPDDMEVFGDFSLIKANPGIQPETSHNMNGMVQYDGGRLTAAATAFYRLTSNIIFLQASPRSSQYQNLLKAQTSGIEAEATYQLTPSLSIWANGTFQHIVNRSKKENTGNIDDRYYNLRLPNKPYLFANSELQWSRKNFPGKSHALQCWYGVNYVNWFYLYWSNDGRRDTKAIIPTQLVHHAGISYAVNAGRAAISFETHNLGNARVYDNYSVQLPGRSFTGKIRLFIDQQKP